MPTEIKEPTPKGIWMWVECPDCEGAGCGLSRPFILGPPCRSGKVRVCMGSTHGTAIVNGWKIHYSCGPFWGWSCERGKAGHGPFTTYQEAHAWAMKQKKEKKRAH